MHLERIDDPGDERISDYRSLTDVALRRRLEPAGGLYMAESSKVLARALRAGHAPRSILTSEKWLSDLERILGDHDVPVYVVSDDVAETVTGYAVHRGMLATMHRPELPSVADVLHGSRVAVLENITDHTNVGCHKLRDGESPAEAPKTRSRVAVLEGLTDHANVGSAFRNAAAMGLDAVLVSPDCADPLYRRSVRVSMGTVFQVPWTRFEEWPSGIDLLKEQGYVVAGMTLGAGAITLDELVAEDHKKLAIVLGSEGHGITPRVDRRLDRRVTIPMMGGVDSLNVAAAAAVAFYATR